MRIAVIYNEPADIQDPSESGVVDQARLIAEFLTESGHAVTTLGVRNASELIAYLSTDRPDAIFNSCEGLQGRAVLEMHVASIYELSGIPYTGTAALGLGVALDKSIAKALLQANGVPTPAYAVISSLDDLGSVEGLRFPLMVKPVAEDASNGIDAGSVVNDRAELSRRVEFVQSRFRQPALVEEFIAGREINAALLAADSAEFIALPLSEIVFESMPEGHPDIVSFEAKWRPESAVYKSTVPRCPADVAPELARQITAIAFKAARAVGLRDYGRVDFRVRREDNAVFVLEVNPNPDISQDSGFTRAARASGRTHGEAIRAIMNRALERIER